MNVESGMQRMLEVLNNLQVDPNLSKTDPLLATFNSLKDPNLGGIEGSANLNGGHVTMALVSGSDVVTVPAISIGGGRTFQAVFRDDANTTADVLLEVHATQQQAVRNIRLKVQPCNSPGGTLAFGMFGVASKSKITMLGNTYIKTSNIQHREWANILSEANRAAQLVALTGNNTVDGDISTSNPGSSVSLTGNSSVGGTSDPNQVKTHIHVGAQLADFPTIDSNVFAPFASNIVDNKTVTSGNLSFKNIRIKAGTNPTFSGNITLQGVVYIEQPNKVTFTGNLSFTGVIATQDATAPGSYNNNTITFTGNFSDAGVETLPDNSDFHTLRQMPGAALLAPGFGVSFTGNSGVVNGCVAADMFSFTGNSGGTFYGPILCYQDSNFSMAGNSTLTFNGSKFTGTPPGFVTTGTTCTMQAVVGSYQEF